MPANLIINADDFGLTPGVNRAIAELHRSGTLTSTTLMATGPAFDDAVRTAHSHPTLGVGCHIILTDGTPVSAPADIPTLIGPDHKSFRPTLGSFVQALLLGRIREQDILREARAQIEKLLAVGIRPTHIDTHKHTHLFPAVNRPLAALAHELGIPAIRNPFESPWSLALGQGSPIRRVQIHLLKSLKRRFDALPELQNHSVLTTDGTIGISATGDLTASTLHQLLAALPSHGTFELCCHPGYNDPDLDRVTTRLRTHRNIEREALLDELPLIAKQPNAPTLIHYGELGETTPRKKP